MEQKGGNMNPRERAALAKRSCRLCGYPFVPEEPEQLYCCEYCESTDRKIDEAEARREERDDV
jgi:hypothetical protein